MNLATKITRAWETNNLACAHLVDALKAVTANESPSALSNALAQLENARRETMRTNGLIQVQMEEIAKKLRQR